jgi:hypothetical protein
MRTCSLYNYELSDKKTTRDKYQYGSDKTLRMKEVQNNYYKNRGFFLAYRRKVATKLGIDLKSLSSITTIQELEDFCGDFLKDRNIEVSTMKTAFLLNVYSLNKESLA